MKKLIGKIENWAFKRIVKDYMSFLRRSHIYKSTDVRSLSLKNHKNYLILAFLIGFLTTLPPVLFEIYFDVFSNFRISYFIEFILLLIGFVLFEFYLLYILGFRLIAQWGVELYESEKSYLNINQKDFIKSLVRIIMELPEKKVTNRHNLNPYEHNSSHIIILSLLYKIKVFATNFLAKFLLKKMLTRSSLRGYASLIAAPITGLWDTYVFWRVISISKFRILERIFYIRLLHFNKSLINSKKVQLLLRLRYYIYGEYNVNLDYILSKTYNGEYYFEKAEILDYGSYIEEKDKLLLALMLAFKYQTFNDMEKEIIEIFNIREDIKYFTILIKDGDLNRLNQTFNELLTV